MLFSRIAGAWRTERLGLIMIMASLMVITVTVLLVLLNQQREERVHINEQGTSLVRVLSRIPYEQFVPEPGKSSVLSVLQQTRSTTALAYLVVVDASGKVIEEIAGNGVIVPVAPVNSDPASWIGQRELAMSHDSRTVSEFHGPLFSAGQLAGYIRLGYLAPTLGFSLEQVVTFATFALPIFLLTPLFYFLVRREVRPMQQVNRQLDELISQGGFSGKVELTPTSEMQDFMTRFNQFIGVAQQRIGQLEVDRTRLETSSKLLSYKRTRIESIIQSLPDGIVVLDESGVVSVANSRAAQIMGLELQEIMGKKPVEWCSSPEVIAYLSMFSGYRNQGYHSGSVEFTPASTPGKTFAVTSYPLFAAQDSSGAPGMLVVIRDVSAEKLARNSSAEFVAHVSHELKSPLNVLAMYSEMLQGEEGDSPQFRVEAANVIHDEVERLAQLINNILNITKIESGSINIERARVKLRDLLEDAFDACSRNGQQKQIDFQLDLPRDISPVAVDKDLIRIAINNLLTNAIKYSDEHGMVRLSVEETEATVRISVQDHGIGIPPEQLERIFEKFYRAPGKGMEGRSGHGLGLSLAREIIQLHQGTLSVNSEPGKGSEFIIEFNKESDLLRKAV